MTAKTFFAKLLLPIFAAGIAFASGPEPRVSRDYFFTQTFGDLPEEMQVARDEGKLGMLLFFESDACPYCKHMHKKVFNQQQVQDWYRERFVSIAVDIHGDVELKDFDGITLPSKIFADHRRVFLTPVVTFVDLDGVEIYRHLGMINTPQEFLILGKYIEDEHYFDTEYEVFLESQGLQNSSEILITPAASGDAM